MLTNYTHTSNGHTCISTGGGSTTIQSVACTGSWPRHQCCRCAENGEILCLEQESNPHLWYSGSVCYHCTMGASLMSPLFPCPPVYIALCLGGQCRLLQITSEIFEIQTCDAMLTCWSKLTIQKQYLVLNVTA